MPPKDNLKYLSKMNKTELKRVAKHESVDISGIAAKAPILSAIKKHNPHFPKAFDLVRMKWSSDPADATEPSTAAQPTEEVEDPRNDTATEIQKLYREKLKKRKEAKEAKKVQEAKEAQVTANLKQEAEDARVVKEAKEAETYGATELQKIVRGRQGRKKAAKKREDERQEEYERKAQKFQDSATSIQKVFRDRQKRKIADAAALSAETATRLIASKKEQKDKDEGPPEEGQFKKITRKNVGDIDDNVKVHIKSNVSPTVTAAAIAKQMQIINKRRFTIGHANIIYHRLGGIAKKATDFL